MFQPVLDFWFSEIEPAQWWKIDADFDRALGERFGHLHGQAMRAELYGWRSSPEGRLAEIIVLDQFSRNLFRNDRRAFDADAMALVLAQARGVPLVVDPVMVAKGGHPLLAQEAVACGADMALPQDQRAFVYMPYMHSESRIIHAVAEGLFRERAPKNNHGFELRHKAIIDRFGRYPHRNAVLQRESTAEEIAFLKEPGSSF